MASTKEYLDFILEQLSGLDEISYKAKNPDGTPHYENTYQYAILKKEWDTK